ncbi:MAG: phage holin family protein [Candidatus Heteroscillospira sp.]
MSKNVRSAFVLFFCGNKVLSLLENIGLMGIESPP